MSDTILSGDFTVYYLSDNRRKQIVWTGSATGIRSLRELYTALQDLFDESGQMDDGVPMSAQTPTEYNLGLIDTGDGQDPWFIDRTTTKHLTGGGLDNDVTRATDSVTGLVRVTRSDATSNIVDGDIGNTITHADGDSGTLLFIYNDWFVIRPTDNTSTHNWDSTSGNITCNGHTDTQITGTTTGKNLWSNIYSLGTIATNTDLYIVRNGTKIDAWWSTGHIDILIVVQMLGNLIDYGILIIYARQYGQLYDYYQITTQTGARNPVPLSTGNDINNNTGYRTFTGSGGNGNTFESGNGIYVGATWATATKKGILTAQATGATPVIAYYLIGDLTDFTASDAVKEYVVSIGVDGDATTTATSPSNTGPASYTGITFTFGADTKDLGNGNGAQPYDVVIDCNGYTLTNFYEYTKYVTRRGSSTTLNALNGEQYTGTGEIQLDYDARTGVFTEGQIVTSAGGATGYITADHYNGDNTGTLVLRTTRNTFVNNENITDPVTGNATVSGTATDLTPIKTAPFGTFAGGNFFGARGVYIFNMHADDGNSYELTDTLGVTQTPPSTISLVVNGVESGDRVSVFRTTGDNQIVDKAYLSSHATSNISGSVTFTTTTTIPVDTPSSGILRVVDNSAPTTEQRYSYTSYTGTVFSGIVKTFGALDAGLDRNYETGDTAYVPYIDEQSTGTSVSENVQYAENRNVVTRVRIKGVVPFSVKGTINSSGYTGTAVRNPDTVYQ